MAVHIIVCIKSVVRSAPSGVARRIPDNSELNPFDRPALEAALQVKQRLGGTVTVLSMGPDVAAAALSEAVAMGADRAVLVDDPALAGSDTLVTSRVLAAAVGRLVPFDLVFFGKRTADSDTGQVGPQTAAVMDIPFVSGVTKIQPRDRGLSVHRIMDQWEEVWHVQTPASMTIDPRAYRPRPVGLVGIARVYEKPSLETWRLVDLGLAKTAVGLSGSPTRVAALETVRRSRTCDMLDGDPQQQVDALMERLVRSGAMGS